MDDFYLLVPRGSEVRANLSARIRSPFKPFSLRLWCTILGVIVATGLVSSYLTLDETRFGEWKKDNLRSVRDHVGGEVYTKFLEILGSGVDPEVHDTGDRFAQRILKLFFGFFVLLATTSYTANLAAMLTNDKSYELDIDSLAACEAARCAVCIHSQTWIYASERFAASPIRMVDGGWTAGENFANLRSGACDVVLLGYSDYETLDVNGAEGLADYQFVAPSIFGYPESAAVADKYQKSISHYLREIIEQDLMNAYWYNHAGDLNNDPWVVLSDDAAETDAIGVADMLGPIALSCISLVVAVFVHDRAGKG